MLTYPLEKRGKTPLYESLYRHIRDDILSGALRAGERLPSRRALAEHLRLSVVTVETAYRQLEAEGYVSVQARRGVFVNETNRPPAPPGAIPEAVAPDAAPRVWKLDLTDNSPDPSLIPAAALARLTRQALSENLEALFVPPPGPGLPALREAIAHDLYEYRGMTVSPEQILVGAGAEYLYLLLPQLLGNSALFALEDPGYLKIRHAYRNSGTRFVCLPLDAHGLNMDALRHSGANVAHISPAHHYPTGLVTPIGRRHALLRWAEESGGWLVEDDYDSELRFTGRPIPTLQSIDHSGRVLYMNTFSQTISPSLRVGYLILPPSLLEVYRRELSFYACTVPTLEQYVLARFLESGQYEQHLSRLRKVYRARRAAVLDAFRENFAGRVTISEQGAGLHFLLRPRADGIRQRAERAGVRLRFLSDYAAAPTPEQRNTVVVHYAALPPERLAEAMALLNEIFC
ncbi:MAG: PLP-dependent aminotransferase family protein [Oscillibacter sp.]|nr:PLP-dependent aminotransferase family protein [Oscillibacter sp.]